MWFIQKLKLRLKQFLLVNRCNYTVLLTNLVYSVLKKLFILNVRG
jgi:hypothetical protein